MARTSDAGISARAPVPFDGAHERGKCAVKCDNAGSQVCNCPRLPQCAERDGITGAISAAVRYWNWAGQRYHRLSARYSHARVSLPTQAARPGPDNRGKPRLLDLERRIPARDRFAPDSPLEEAVTSEPVSENRNFPASREFTGNFIESGLGGASTAAKKHVRPEPYGPIPYASEQGIKSSLEGN